MIITDFRCPLEGFTVIRPSIADWHRCDVLLIQGRLLASCDQLVGVLESLQLFGIAQQQAREGHHFSNAGYRQHGEQGYHRCEALPKSIVRLNLGNALLHFAAFIAVLIRIDVIRNHL